MATYTWEEFRSAALGFITDRKPTDGVFAVAVQEYVRARIALDLLNDKDSYALKQRRYTELRRSLAAYETGESDESLRSSVKALLRDTGANNAMFAEAVANFVRAQWGDANRGPLYTSLRLRLAGYATTHSDADLRSAVKGLLRESHAGNEMFAEAVAEWVRMKMSGGDKSFERYQQLKRSLAGYATTQNEADLHGAVKTLLRPSSASDTLFTEAVVEFVRSKLGNEGSGQRFAALKRELAGFGTTLNDGQIQGAVRTILSDGARTNTMFAKACALYARAEIAREIDARDQEGIQSAKAVADKCAADYRELRIRLAGFTHTFANAAALLTEVKKYLPVDQVRTNTDTFLSVIVANAAEDLQSLNAWIDAQISTAKTELQGVGTWINAEIANAKSDLEGVDVWLNNQIATAKADLIALDDWINRQIEAAKADVEALKDRVDRELRAAVINLQDYIRAYTVGHSRTIVEGDIEQDGNASLGRLPEDSQLRSARIKRFDSAWSAEPSVVQDEVSGSAGVVTAISSDETRVRSISFTPASGNVGSVKVGYRTDTPMFTAPFSFDAVPGKAYDLSEFVIQTENTGDTVGYIAIEYEDVESDETPCRAVKWEDRYEQLVRSTDCGARIAVDPKGIEFMVTPKLVEDYTQLIITYDGLKLEFEDADEVPFDEGAARAVGMWINGALGMEWGESAAQVMNHKAEYATARTRLYLRHKGRSEVRA